MQVMVDPAPANTQARVDPPPIDPLAKTVAATQASDHPALPSVPAAQVGVPAPNLVAPGAGPPVESVESSAGLPADTTGRFVPVRPGELDIAPPIRPAAAWISPQTWALLFGLVAVWLLAWYLLQPPSADALYHRIQRQTTGGSLDVPPRTEDDIGQFLVRFPHDPRSEGLRDLAERIEIAHLGLRLDLHAKGINLQASLLPIERVYVDAFNAARVDPEVGIARFEAMIDLFESSKDDSGPNRRCIQLAKQRLGEFRQQYEVQSREQLTIVEERVKRADELRKTNPQRANAIYRAVLVLYENKAWAKHVVQRARAALEKGK